MADYAGFTEMVTPRTVPAVVIAAAMAASANIITSGDRHLLSICTHQGIQILRPAEVLASIAGGPDDGRRNATAPARVPWSIGEQIESETH